MHSRARTIHIQGYPRAMRSQHLIPQAYNHAKTPNSSRRRHQLLQIIPQLRYRLFPGFHQLFLFLFGSLFSGPLSLFDAVVAVPSSHDQPLSELLPPSSSETPPSLHGGVQGSENSLQHIYIPAFAMPPLPNGRPAHLDGNQPPLRPVGRPSFFDVIPARPVGRPHQTKMVARNYSAEELKHLIPYNVGNLIEQQPCLHCGALQWPNERPNAPHNAKKNWPCCMNGPSISTYPTPQSTLLMNHSLRNEMGLLGNSTSLFMTP